MLRIPESPDSPPEDRIPRRELLMIGATIASLIASYGVSMYLAAKTDNRKGTIVPRSRKTQ